MLTQVTEHVWVRTSAFCQSNAIVICGEDGALLVDPGVDGGDLEELAGDLDELGWPVVAGFSTHPHWDHLLWHARFGDVRRWATPLGAQVAGRDLEDARAKAARLAPGAPLELLGAVTPLPATTVPWPGPVVRVIEHRAHAPGHAALVIEDDVVLVAGDMLSDVEMPLLDLAGGDPVGDYIDALDVLGSVEATTLVPGHGAIARGAAIQERLENDRAYLAALQASRDPSDPRVDADYGRDWLPDEHRRQVAAARRGQ